MTLKELIANLFPLPIEPEESNARPLDLEVPRAKLPVVPGPVDRADHRKTGVHLLVGQAATLAGAAKIMVSLWQNPPAWSVSLSVYQYELLGEYLFRFGTRMAFGTEIAPTESNVKSHWTAGTLLPLPLLMSFDAAGSPIGLIADLAALEQVVAREPRLVPETRRPVGSLHAFDPFRHAIAYERTNDKGERRPSPPPAAETVAAERAEVLTDYLAKPADWRRTWAGRAVWNPYAAALPLVHLVSSLSAPARADLVNAVFGPAGATAHELGRIAQTSGGLVLLRVAFTLSAGLAGTDAARARIAALLQVPETADLRSRSVFLPAAEPPALNSAALSRERKPDLVIVPTFLGRPVRMTWIRYKQDSEAVWDGPSAAGSVYPSVYFDPNRTEADVLKQVGNAVDGAPLTTEQLHDRMRVISAIFEIEGFADAVRSADRALVSLGMQQFSFHVAEEGTVLLHRLRFLSDVWFDVFFRSGGFEVGAVPQPVSGRVDIEELQKAQVKAASVPELPRPIASSAAVTELDVPAWLIRLSADGRNQWCVPGRVGRLQEGEHAVPSVSGEPGAKHTDCHLALGFIGNTAGPVTEDFLARWAVAARLVPEAIQAQLELSVHRFNRMVRYAGQQIQLTDRTGTSRRSRWEWIFQRARAQLSMEELFPSPAHVAALIDCFINTPSAALGAARRAFDRAVSGWEAEHQASEPVDATADAFKVRMLMAYLSEHRYFTVRQPESDPKNIIKPESWYRRGGSNNVSANRTARLLDRLEEVAETPGLGPRRLRWTETFHW